MLLAKYTYQKLRVFGGYEFISFADPSSPLTTGFTDIAGIPVLFGNITKTPFVHDEHLQIMWTGARYAFTDTLDAGVAYYHYDQNSFGKTFCADNSASTCAGTLDAVSINVDWKFAKKFDAYAALCTQKSTTDWRTATSSPTISLRRPDFVSSSEGR